MCQGLNSHYFHIIGDGHQPNSRGLYTHYKDSPFKGWMTIPNIATFDHGTYVFFNQTISRWWQLKDFWNFHPEPWGFMIQFDEHIFQMG